MKTYFQSFSIRSSIVYLILFLPITQSVLQAQIEEGSFDFDGNKRNYMVFLPKINSTTSNLPLVIYLHSYGWTAQQDMDYTKLYEVADTSGFIIAYPSGLPNWNSGISDDPGFSTSPADDVGFINALIDTLYNHYSIDTERVYACGYSNGGFMAYRLASQLSNRIAAIASVCGTMSNSIADSFNPQHPMPVLEIHGTEDLWVPFNGSSYWLSVEQTLNYWVSYDNCPGEANSITLPDMDTQDGCTVEKVSHTKCNKNGAVIFYKVINGGHTWPGAGLPGYNNEGNVTGDINANVVIWNFFKNYSLDVSTKVVNYPSNQSIHKMLLFPNPASDNCYLKSDLHTTNLYTSKIIINIFNLVGKK